jgi:hypothetical protein
MAKQRTKSPSKGKRKRARARAPNKSPAKPRQYDPLDALIDASARALDLPLDPAWRPAIKTNLEVTLRMAATFADFPLPDDAEPAPVFTA